MTRKAGAKPVGVKFFGQYLIEQGVIDASELREALDLTHARNRQLGVIAVQRGYLRQSDADWINLQQRTTDRPFGELALELEMLSKTQLDAIVAIQQETRLFIGEALVQLESVPADRLPSLLSQFEIDQAPFELERRRLDPELSDNPIAQIVLDLLPKFCMRVAKMSTKIGPGQPLCKLSSYPFNVGLTITGSSSLVVILVSDDVFGRELASGVSGINPSRLSSELIYDGLGEFLNILCGNAVAILEQDRLEMRLDPPTFDCNIGRGIVFELVAGDGCASVILESV